MTPVRVTSTAKPRRPGVKELRRQREENVARLIRSGWGQSYAEAYYPPIESPAKKKRWNDADRKA